MTDCTPTTDPDVLVLAVDDMGWSALESTARAILTGLGYVVESSGAQRKEISIARPHAESSPPTSAPMCPCGCPSRQDHWRGRLDAARDRDVDDAGGWDDPAAVAAAVPRRFRDAVFQAAEELRLARSGPRSRPEEDDEGRSSMSGPERSSFICDRYVGIPSARAAHLESLRAGPVDRAAIRRCRSRAGLGIELGLPRTDRDGRPLLPEEVGDEIVTLHRTGMTNRQIATALDMGTTSVDRLLPPLLAAAKEREAVGCAPGPRQERDR